MQTGLQLCDDYESSKYGAAQCGGFGGGCQGASDGGNCYSYHVWSSSSYDTAGYYYDRYLFSGSFGSHYYVPVYAFTVRCVLDLMHISAENTQDTGGLQLCDRDESSSYGAAWCARLEDGCVGGYSGRCHPYHIWSGSESGSKYYAPYLVEGRLGLSGPCDGDLCPASIAFTVRCLLLALYGHRVRAHPYRPRLRCAVSWI